MKISPVRSNYRLTYDDERLFCISKSYMSDQMIAIFSALNGRVDDYTDRPHKLIYPS